MNNYKHLQEEKDAGGHGSEKHHAMVFGRMNPPTAGHEQVVNKMHEVAKKNNATHELVLSGSHDTTDKEKKAGKNPLSPEQKVQHAKNAFSGTKITAAKRGETILHHAAAAHAAGTEHLHVIAGSDRHKDLNDLLHKYNGQKAAHGHYNFKSITLHSSGERDPDSEGTSGISGSKMRQHASTGNKEAFHSGAPSKMKPEHKDAMYNDLRKSQGLKESLRPEMGAGAYVNDFITSTNPKFNNKSKEERRRMAIGAFMAAKARGVKEEVQIDELSNDLLGKYKTAAGADAKAADAAGNYAKGDKRFKGINKATNKQFDNDLKKSTQMKEGTLQGNIGGGDAMNTTTSAPSGSTTKDTTMGKKIKGFKFFNGENDKQMNMNQPVKEEVLDEANIEPTNAKSRTHIGNLSHPVVNSVVHSGKQIGLITKQPNGEFHAHHSAAKLAHAQSSTFDSKEKAHQFIRNAHAKAIKNGTLKASKMSEEKKDDVPFDGPYKSSFKKPNNPNRTGMDAARSLAQRAMDQLSKKKPVKEEKDEREYGYEGDMALNQLATLTRCAEMIKDCLKPETDLPEWVQSKITLATDYIQTAADYLYSESEVNEQHAPVAPVPDKKYIKGTPENKAYKATKKPINGVPTNVKEENLDEKSDQARKNKIMKNVMDASKGAKYNRDSGLKITPGDTGHATNQQMNKAIGRALRNEAIAQKGVNVDKVNSAGQEPHEEKFETAPKTVSKIKKVKEENMKSYKEFLQSLEEKLIGKQHKLDKNKNNEVDAHDFELLRKEEADHLLEYTPGPDGKTIIKGRSYGADYVDPEGAFETKDDMKKPEKAGRKTGQRTGSYKPRNTMSKLKSAGSTYK
jgi:hypothetical protein